MTDAPNTVVTLPTYEYRIYWELGRDSGYSAWGDAPDDITTDDELHAYLQRGGVPVGLDLAIETAGFGWSADLREKEDPHA